MQRLEHKHFTTMPTGRQVRSKSTLLSILHCYVRASKGFATIGKNDKVRPWFKRYEV